MTFTRRRLWICLLLVAGLAAIIAVIVRPGQDMRSSDPASTDASPSAVGRGVLPTRTTSLPRGPKTPPVRVCGNKTILGNGPKTAPKGAVVIPAGDDSGTVLGHNWTMQPHTTYWFAPGRHTLGNDRYGQIIPADGDTFIGAPGAVIDGRHVNLYAFTQRAKDVTIRYLTIERFGAPGDNGGQEVVNGDAGTGWHIDHVTARENAGAGVMLGSGNVLAYSCLQGNGEYGFQAAGSHITVDHDEIADNNMDDWEGRQPGCGCSGGAKFWGVDRAVVTSNYVHDNLGPGLWADTNNRGFDVEHDYFAGNEGEGLIYETSYNLRLVGNTFVRNALVGGPKLKGFPDSAVYISESGADPRIPGPYGKTLEIAGNTFTDNWGGVVLWENADRYCASGANTSTGYCTLVNPSTATIRNCGNPTLLKKMPYYSDCRWKTQNVQVSKNTFTFNPAHIGPDCTTAEYCGFNGVFSQWGSWSVYHDTTVEKHITFSQNNHFSDNRYVGPWSFMVEQQGNLVNWAMWRGSPYRQDVGSTVTESGK